MTNQSIRRPARMIRAQCVQLVVDGEGNPLAVILGDDERAAFVASDIVSSLNAQGRYRLSATRPWVAAFADEMEAKLAQNRHKGDREGWINDSRTALIARLNEEVRELMRACQNAGTTQDAAVISEAADVANFAMMIADVAGGLKPKPGAERP
jgi:NTP pyrophosphatase (non-canonical NTP hydrolase)